MATTKRGPKKASKAKPATKTVQPIPPGCPAITANLRIRGAAQALEFYKKAFVATETSRMGAPMAGSCMPR